MRLITGAVTGPPSTLRPTATASCVNTAFTVPSAADTMLPPLSVSAFAPMLTPFVSTSPACTR